MCDGDNGIAKLLLNGAKLLNSSDCMPLCLQWWKTGFDEPGEKVHADTIVPPHYHININ